MVRAVGEGDRGARMTENEHAGDGKTPTADLKNRLTDKPVAVLGNGVSGKAAAGLLQRLGADPVIYDEQRSVGGRDDFTAAAFTADDDPVKADDLPSPLRKSS